MELLAPIEGHPSLPATNMLHPELLRAFRGTVKANYDNWLSIEFPTMAHAVAYCEPLLAHYDVRVNVFDAADTISLDAPVLVTFDHKS